MGGFFSDLAEGFKGITGFAEKAFKDIAPTLLTTLATNAIIPGGGFAGGMGDKLFGNLFGKSALSKALGQVGLSMLTKGIMGEPKDAKNVALDVYNSSPGKARYDNLNNIMDKETPAFLDRANNPEQKQYDPLKNPVPIVTGTASPGTGTPQSIGNPMAPVVSPYQDEFEKRRLLMQRGAR